MRSQTPFPKIAILSAHRVARNLDQALGLASGSWSSTAGRGKKPRRADQELSDRSSEKSCKQPAFRYGTISRWQVIQMQQALESFEEEFHLPAQPIQLQDSLIREPLFTHCRQHPGNIFLRPAPHDPRRYPGFRIFDIPRFATFSRHIWRYRNQNLQGKTFILGNARLKGLQINPLLVRITDFQRAPIDSNQRMSSRIHNELDSASSTIQAPLRQDSLYGARRSPPLSRQ